MIKVLEKNVADKIAAGEVIERPVSIVKELVENSVDSGADSIVVEIKNGGKSYIRVTDNGCGISSDEAETAFLRHATSKIETAGDLDAIETLGFRGEALASIAAVTHTEFITKTREEKTGTRILIHGSEVLEKKKTGCPDGTTIVVTDLFYNTPARRKFLKTDSAESGQIIDFMSQIALAYPAVRFRFINNGSILFSTTGNGDLLSAVLSVYKLREYQDLLPVSHEENGNTVTGYISRPSLSKSNRKNQVFFVNGRVVNSKVIERGLTEGYRERLFDRRYPVAFLFLKTDPGRLDVNIHPNKKEVRFDNEAEIVSLVESGVKSALGTRAAVAEVKNVFKESEGEGKTKNVASVDEQVDIKYILSNKRKEAGKIELETSERADSTENRIYEQAEFVIPPSNKDIADITMEAAEKQAEYKPVSEFTVFERKTDDISEPSLEKTQFVPPPRQNAPVSKTKSSAENDIDGNLGVSLSKGGCKPDITIDAPALQPFDFTDLTLTGAIFDTYITAVDHKNFYLIDQHDAHERVIYEKLVEEYLSEEKLCQPILMPIVIEVPLSVKENEYDWLDSLCDMGFLIEEFGQNSYVIREIPTFMTLSEAEEFAKEFTDSVTDGTKLQNTVIINKLITKSCKSAVKAHDRLSMEEMKALIAQLAVCRNPFSCPHGRPTFIRLSQYEIEKMFKRV